MPTEGITDDTQFSSQEEDSSSTGPPTREELLTRYPAKFTWNQLKTFVNSGDLGLLKRDRKLQKRYDDWVAGIVKQHGSMVNYLLNYRLQWGKTDALSLLTSSLNEEAFDEPTTNGHTSVVETPYFCVETPRQFISVIQNDWPYSVPPEVEHTLIWTKRPIYHPSLVADSVKPRIEQDGLWGFTGTLFPPPSPSTLPSCLPALAEWGITIDSLVRSAPGTEEEDVLVRRAGKEVDRYVRMRWREGEWETAWFVNPPRLQSVPGLAHIHVFARRLKQLA